MNTLSSEERNALKDSVSKLMSDASTEAEVRRVMETAQGFDLGSMARIVRNGRDRIDHG